MAFDLIRKIKNVFEPQAAAPASGAPESTESPSEKRLHGRFAMGSFGSFYVKAGASEVELHDLSYGGFAVKLPQHASMADWAKDGVFEISFFHRRARCQALFVAARGQTLGFSFMHTGTESLLFLRSLIEPMKAGDSMKPIEKSVVNAKLDTPNHMVLRGLGPSDIVIKCQDGAPQRIEEGAINYLQDGYYREVKFADGRVLTPGSVEEGLNAKGRHVRNGVDYDDVLTATLILMGAHARNDNPALMDWIRHNGDALRRYNQGLREAS